jgi:apolipoprotein N-acyltransferase
METRDIVFSVIMVISAFILTYQWLGRFGESSKNPLIIFAAIVMVGSLAVLILSIITRLRNIEQMMESKERSLRINIQSVEDNLDKRIGDVQNSVNNAMDELNRKKYR